MLTPTDAKQETIVRKALESALVSGVARPVVAFTGSHWYLGAQLSPRGTWTVTGTFGPCWDGRDFQTLDLTTDDAVALIVSTARCTL